MTSIYKVVMSLSPGALLSTASRDRCITNLNETLPFEKIGKTRQNTSVLIPICVDNCDVCILYTLRSFNLKTYSGQVAFPGGIKYENETVYETVLRETEEEIGVPAEDIEIWTKMIGLQTRVTKILITPIVGVLKNFDMKKLKPNKDEVADIFTVPIKVLCDKTNHGCYMYNENVALPVFSGGKHRVFGITGMFTHLFLQSFLPSKVYNANFMRKKYKLRDLMPAKM